MPRKPSSEPCQEKGGQYIHKSKRNGAAGRSIQKRSVFRELEYPTPHELPGERQIGRQRSKLCVYVP